ncbi:MAG: VWA domain-containing protein [Planctomycetaceae bacterium]
MNAMRFADPIWFFALLALLPLIVKVITRRRNAAVTYSSLSILEGMKPTWRSRLRPFIPWLRVIGLTCIVIALARPQAGIKGFRERREGIAIQICLDRSSSMSAEDFQLGNELVDRLTAVKDVIKRFVQGDDDTGLSGRVDDQIGLIAFGGFSEVRCPATLDHDVFQEILADVNLPEPERDADGDVLRSGYNLYTEEGATAIGDALAMSADQLRKSDAKTKIIILLSDGEHNAGVLSPDQAIEVAKEFGIRVYSIGVGSSGRRFVRFVSPSGEVGYRPIPLKLDEETLKKIASQTGGKYFHANNTDALVDVYREINELEKTSTEGTVYRDYRELCFPWLLAGCLFAVLELLMTATLFKGVP